MNKDILQLTGVVKKVLPAGYYQVELSLESENKKLIIAELNIKTRNRRRKQKKNLIFEGSRVEVEVSPFDFNKGQIISILTNENKN